MDPWDKGFPRFNPMSQFQCNWHFINPSSGYQFIVSFILFPEDLEGQLFNLFLRYKKNISSIISYCNLLQVFLLAAVNMTTISTYSFGLLFKKLPRDAKLAFHVTKQNASSKNNLIEDYF